MHFLQERIKRQARAEQRSVFRHTADVAVDDEMLLARKDDGFSNDTFA